MIFGDKFYRLLDEMSIWQQSLFSLILASRMSPNLYLYCNLSQDTDLREAFRKAIDAMWVYHTDKNNHVSLDIVHDDLEKVMPVPDPEGSYGAYPAFDACQALVLAIEAITEKNGDEALNASNISVCTVAKFLEVQEERSISDDELRERKLMEEEMDFQVELLSRLRRKRESSWIQELYEEFCNVTCSNIGISSDSEL